MGSKVLKNSKDYYFLGLWLADGYWRSSSIGLCSTNNTLILRFRKFLKRLAPSHEIKERIYEPGKGYKGRLIAKHIYVNSRQLTRFFMEIKHQPCFLFSKKFLPAYFAGRIDGDGHVDFKHRTGIRIAYSDEKDATRDLNLLKKLDKEPASLYYYSKARTWILYFRKNFLRKITPKMSRFSIKLKTFAP